MYQVIDGKKISQEIKDELKEKAAAMAKEGKKVALAVIQVGNDPASSVYVRNKKKACEYIGIESLSYELPEETTEEELVAVLEEAIRLLEEKADGSQKNVREKPVDMQEKKKDAELENGNVRMSAVAENIRQYIDMHYKEDISLQSVAEEMNYSDAYFCKIFKQCFDKSFIGYLTEYRLERAKQLLADVRINVKDISVNVGYRDSNYFAKVFKRAMGSTPTEYRMEILKQMNKGNTAGGLG